MNMGEDTNLERHGDYLFPEEAEVHENLLYTIPFGSSKVEDLKWEGYVDVAHSLGVDSIESEVVDSGQWDSGIKYAVVKVTVVRDGKPFSALQAADETTNQVRDPEFVWAVAESRALKRAIKKAYNILPAKADASEEPDPVDKPDDVEFGDGHALSEEYDDPGSGDTKPSTGGSSGEGW